MESLQKKESKRNFTLLSHIWEIFSQNGEEIKNDFERITKGRTSQKLDELSIKVGDYPLFIEDGARVECAFLNCKEGPIYIGKDAEIMECCHLQWEKGQC